MTAGYSGTPLAKKLGIKPGARVLLRGAPKGFEDTLAGLPDDATVLRAARGAPFDVMVSFHKKASALDGDIKAMRARMTPAAGLWIAWPKKSSGVATDVTESIVRKTGLASGLVDNKICAIDETWSGLRFVIRVADRRKK
ncbi:MAG: hypothetical protein R3B57_01205 [Phycisphaerales bacterium]